jgi:hypothetical protein
MARTQLFGHALREHLQSLLEHKSSQLQMLGTMGQEILKQQTELEERIRGFDVDDDEVGESTKRKLSELDEAMRTWESQNEGMVRELGGKVRTNQAMLTPGSGRRLRRSRGRSEYADPPTTQRPAPRPRYGVCHRDWPKPPG